MGLSREDKQTPPFIRFSTVAGERGATDAERGVRGSTIKRCQVDAGHRLRHR